MIETELSAAQSKFLKKGAKATGAYFKAIYSDTSPAERLAPRKFSWEKEKHESG